MDIVSYCPKCYKGTRFPSADAPREVVCGRCGERRGVRLTESIVSENVVDRCVFCGCGHFYIEKDFNGYVGFGVIVAAVVGSGIAWAYNVVLSIGILAAAALVDLVFWAFSRERTVCYKCVATYRDGIVNPAHERYELGTAGRFAEDFDEQNDLHKRKGPDAGV